MAKKSWINKDAFAAFVEEKKNEKENTVPDGFKKRMEMQWKNPVKGTESKAKVYVGRFLPDPKGQMYKKYYYHMFAVGEKWQFHLCPKTYNFDNYCPWCSVTSKLYSGTSADKNTAKNMKRKEKYLGNFYIVDDPRDHENEDKVNKTVKMYEFPSKLEAKIKEQITDSKNGLGSAIFDPGESGFDLIIKITSTKKDAAGKEWPDYGLSDFSRKSYALGTDDQIEEIMSQTMDMDEYLKSMERDEDTTKETLKQLMLWDLVSDEMEVPTKVPEATVSNNDNIPEFKEEVNKSMEPEGEEPSDEELLKQLDDL